MPSVHAELDPLDTNSLLTDAERALRDRVARIVDEEILPHAAPAYEAGVLPREVVAAIGRAGAFGPWLTTHGGPGLGAVACGLVLQELERADSGFRSCASVQGSLVMWPIATFGSEAQKDKWLPRLRTGEALGCFALTEPTSGSDPASMKTRAVKDGDGYVLSGHKRWSTNGLSAEVAVVWAKVIEPGGPDPEGPEGSKLIRGFLVERGMPGFEPREIKHKMSLRASESSELFFHEVRLPASAMLPGAKGLGAPLKCLNEARMGIAWGAVGAATACYASARDYTKARVQFGRPLASFQLVQAKLAQMYSDIGTAQLVCTQLGRLKEQGKLTPTQVSFAKRQNVAMALDTARVARDMLGANGILLDHPPIRHAMNLETVKTYEGTHDVHTLVLGRAVTGMDAFS
ncbi:MAG: acyl-CoA dehydrogenase family protein [Deltaproteobacteria bacterium]|nr:acyl-CoA dehydrogenase family protein [Deltaproteobacteria bacterium]